MIREFRRIENSYIRNFAEMDDRGDHIIFWDEKLPDMYAFNCTLIKENMDKNKIKSFVADELDHAKSSGREFLKIIFHPEFEITDSDMDQFSDMGFRAQTFLYMLLGDDKLNDFKGSNDCIVVRAVSEKHYEDGQRVDIEGCINAGIPEEFAKRKSLRKKEVFGQNNGALFSYLCYYQDTPAGKCELHMKDKFAKIEDFDILDSYQRRGFGTAMLKKMISDALKAGKEYIYLIAAKADTPKKMYEKLGFEIIGEETELFWSK